MKITRSILIHEMRTHVRGLLFIFFLTLLGVCLEALTPWPFKLLIDNVLGKEALEEQGILRSILSLFHSREALGLFAVALYCLSSLGGSLTDYFTSKVTKQLGQAMVAGFAARAFKNLERLNIGHYRKQEIGDYIYRLSYDTSALGELMEDGLLPLATNCFYLIVTITILFFIHWKLTLLALAILPFLGLALGAFNRCIGKASAQSERSNSALFSFIEEMLTQLKLIQAFNQQNTRAIIFDTKEQSSLRDETRVSGLGFLMNLAIGAVVAVGYGTVLVWGMRLVFLGEMSTGLLIVFIFYLDNLTNPLLSFMSAASSIRENVLKVSRMEDFFNPAFQRVDVGTRKTIDSMEIVFRAVSLFGDNNTRILHKASFTIPAGKRTVIVGVSGSGKTTVLNLILRFIENVHKGTITIGSYPIQEYSFDALRDLIAYVPQEITLFNATVHANITFGSPHASFAAVARASRMALADPFIRRLSGGYHCVVGEGGGNISGGQRQRILIARAFVREHAKLFILDEPFSALDIKTRFELMEHIETFSKGKTTIIVSNVLELVSKADHVIVLNQGTVLHEGKSKALLEQKHLANLILHSA